jgi:hypothetical protein
MSRARPAPNWVSAPVEGVVVVTPRTPPAPLAELDEVLMPRLPLASLEAAELLAGEDEEAELLAGEDEEDELLAGEDEDDELLAGEDEDEDEDEDVDEDVARQVPVRVKNSVLVTPSTVAVAYASSKTDPAGADTTTNLALDWTVPGTNTVVIVPFTSTANTAQNESPNTACSPGRTNTQPSVVGLAVSPKEPQSFVTFSCTAVSPSLASKRQASPCGTPVASVSVAAALRSVGQSVAPWVVACPTTLVMVPTPAVPRPMKARPAMPMAAPATRVPGPVPRMSATLITFLPPSSWTLALFDACDAVGTIAGL